jgi:hypothetical protein
MAPYFPPSLGIRGNDKEAPNIAGAGLCNYRTLSHRGLRCFADLIPLIVDFIFLVAGFISLFGHLGNFPSGAS